MRTLLITFLLSFGYIQAQVGVNTTTPNAALEIDADEAGVLIPRIALTSAIDEVSVLNPQGGTLVVSTLIYNTATAGTGINSVVPGFYYWNGVRWLAVGGDGRDWTIFGNFDINPDNNYIGTRNNVDFRVRTNNIQRFSFTSNGRLRAYDNGTEGLPTYSWNGDIDTGFWRPAADNLAFSTNGLERVRINNVGNVGIGNTTPFAPLHFQNNTENRKILLWQNVDNDHQFYGFGVNSNTLRYQIAGINDRHVFFCGNSTTTSSELMRIQGNGNVGIGTTAPSRRLHINNATAGALRLTDGTQANGRVLTSDGIGVATWRDMSISSITGVISGVGASIPYNTFNYINTGSTITLPPGRWAVNVTMLMRRQLAGATPNNSSFWLRTSFTTLNQATLTQAQLNLNNDIVGGIYISGNYPGSSIYSLVQGMVIINNTSAGNRTYYYVAGSVDSINTTDTLINFGRNTLGENVITAYRL
ncbi:MAG: hypothetical protein ACK4RM_03940 [Flavobacterium sp.]